MPEISVLMPSYNVVDYIHQCMESVLAQTFTDIEILAIDAGSKDGTWEALSEYASKDSRVRLIRSEKKSYGYQINLGIKQAQGKYIGIVETDDFIDPEMYSLLYKRAIETDADYVKGQGLNYVQITPEVFFSEKIDNYIKWGINDQIIDPCEHPELMYMDRFLWLGLYKTSFLRENSIHLSETAGAAYQDIGFQAQILMKAKKAVYFDIPLYYYRLDNSGASGYSRKAFQYLNYEHENALSEAFGMPDELKKYQVIKMVRQYMHRYHVMAVSGSFWEESQSDMDITRKRMIDALDSGLITKEDFDEDLYRRIQVLRSGVRESFGVYLIDHLRHMSDVRKWINRLKENLELSDRSGKIVIFGCGLNGKYVRCLFERLFPDSVVAFCDNDAKNATPGCLGIKILSPKEAVRDYPKATFMIPSTRYESEMRTQLSDLGIEETSIMVYPFLREKDLLTMDVRDMI